METLGSRKTLWTRPYWAPTRYKAQRPKYDVASPRQILDVNLFGRFPLTPDEFEPDTGAIGSVLKLSFHPSIVRPNPTPYATWASVLVRAVSGVRNRNEIESVWASILNRTSALALHASKAFSTPLLVLSCVPKYN